MPSERRGEEQRGEMTWKCAINSFNYRFEMCSWTFIVHFTVNVSKKRTSTTTILLSILFHKQRRFIFFSCFSDITLFNCLDLFSIGMAMTVFNEILIVLFLLSVNVLILPFHSMPVIRVYSAFSANKKIDSTWKRTNNGMLEDSFCFWCFFAFVELNWTCWGKVSALWWCTFVATLMLLVEVFPLKNFNNQVGSAKLLLLFVAKWTTSKLKIDTGTTATHIYGEKNGRTFEFDCISR